MLAIWGLLAIVFRIIAWVFMHDFYRGQTTIQGWLGLEPSRPVVLIGLLLSAGSGVGWALSAWALSAPHVTEPDPRVARRSGWIRGVARATQWCWPVATVLSMVYANAIWSAWTVSAPVAPKIDFGVNLCGWIAGMLRLAAMCGLGALSFHLSTLADWGNDTTLRSRFNAAGFGLAITAPFSLACFSLAGLTGNLLFGLAALTRRALVSQNAAIARDKRLIENARREREAARTGKASPFQDRRFIQQPTLCVGYSFDVQGLKYGDRCPECGHRIGESS